MVNFVVVVPIEYGLDWCEVWTIAVICIMVMDNAGINSAVQLGRTAVNNHGVDMRKDVRKTKQKSINYVSERAKKKQG